MIERLSKRISNSIKNVDPEITVSTEVLEYSIGVRLNFVATVALSFILGLITGHLLDTLITLTAFVFVRKFSGGYHMKSLTLCAIFSALLFASIPLIPLPSDVTSYVTALASIIFLMYSPNIMEELNPSKLEPYYKYISLIIVLSNFVINSPILGLACLAQGMLIIPWKEVLQNEEKNSA